MSNSPKRNHLFCSAAMLSLLAALYIPVSLAEENHSDHGRHAVDSSKAASEKQLLRCEAGPRQSANGSRLDESRLDGP